MAFEGNVTLGVYLSKYSLGFVPVPKVACTTLKTALFQLENSFEFNEFSANSRQYYIHDFYASVEFERASQIVKDASFRFCVLRDPVERFVSAYVNRVVMHKDILREVSGHEARLRGLSREPSLAEMVDRIADYRACSPSVDYHFAPMVLFLGSDPGFYSRLYRFSQLGQLAADLSALTRTEVALGHWQASPSHLRIPKSSIDPRLIRRIEALYADDYRTFHAQLG